MIAMIGSIGGTALSAFGQIQAGNAAEQAANANAQLITAEGQAKREAAKYEGLKLSRERVEMIDQQKATYGAAGIDISSGTPLDVMARTASEYERDIGYTGIKADQEMWKAQNEASIMKWKGKQAKYAGWLGAGSTLLSGFGKTAASYGGGGK